VKVFLLKNIPSLRKKNKLFHLSQNIREKWSNKVEVFNLNF
jgi:hypothetical protein